LLFTHIEIITVLQGKEIDVLSKWICNR